MDNLWIIAPYVVLVLCCFVAAWSGAALKTWHLRRVYLELEYRLADLEGRVTREVKIRAGAEARKNRAVDEEILLAAAEQPSALPQNEQQIPPFLQWREQMKKRV